MDFASSTRAGEDGTRWTGIVTNPSVVPRRLLLWDRIESKGAAGAGFATYPLSLEEFNKVIHLYLPTKPLYLRNSLARHVG